MSSEFRGKTALVTGASRGIGAATAVALARAGVARVVIHYNSNREGADAAVKAVKDAGAEADLIQADLGSESGIRTLIDAAPKSVDILVNNAGHLVKRAKLLESTPDLYDQVMNLNVKSVWFLTQAIAPSMIERGNGIIVNVSSIAARNGGGPGATIYAAAKAAIACMTKGMARELAPHGIRVNAISPGTVDNDFHVAYSTREMLDTVVKSTPAGRLGTNEEMADCIVFLCSDQSRYIHGQTIELNGGMFMV
jgi:NAD(P)-dependent dehydrogenase (short-subunit alcohol dehydrogenase family)